jgi:hypothetical protein
MLALALGFQPGVGPPAICVARLDRYQYERFLPDTFGYLLLMF